MIGAWMAYAALLAVLFSGVALAAEHTARLYRRPTRWIWVGAMVLSLGVPGALLVTPSSAPHPASPVLLLAPQFFVSAVESRSAPPPISVVSAPVVPVAERLNPLLLAGWGLGSLLLLGIGFRAHRRLSRARRGWRRGRVAGARVWLSRRIGPAVVGVLRPEIVLPEQVLRWDAEAQRLVVEHEREHLRAGDPRLLALGWLAVVLCPWNPALWWQLARLRLATETDCDARVLRYRPDVRRYGALLLEVGRLASGVPVTVVTFSEPRSFLERRIHAMTAPRARRRLRSMLLSGALCALGIASIAAVPVPDRPELEAWLPREIREAEPVRDTIALVALEEALPVSVEEVREIASAAADTVRPRLLNPSEIQAALVANYPPLLRDAGISGVVLMEVETDVEGEVVRTRALHAPHDALASAARRTLSDARFSPATVAGRAIPFRFTIPVEFALPAAAVEEADLPTISTVTRLVPVEEVGRTIVSVVTREEMQAIQEALRASAEEVQTTMPELQQSLKELRAAQPEIQEALREAEIRAREVARAVADTSRFRSGAFRSGTRVLRVEPRVFRPWRQEWRQEMERDRARIHVELERRHPEIAASGTGDDAYVWFMVDGEDRVLASGTHPLTLGPAKRFGGRGAWHTSTVEEELSTAYPRVRIENVMITRGPIKGEPMNIAWVTLESGSPAP